MLLAEHKEEDTHTCYFDSSNILACKYKRGTKQLAIIFKGGTQYLYENIVPYTFQRFKVANSQGREFNTLIKGKYQYAKVAEGLDLSVIYETIEALKEKPKENK